MTQMPKNSALAILRRAELRDAADKARKAFEDACRSATIGKAAYDELRERDMRARQAYLEELGLT